jgi:hypothetical protein
MCGRCRQSMLTTTGCCLHAGRLLLCLSLSPLGQREATDVIRAAGISGIWWWLKCLPSDKATICLIGPPRFSCGRVPKLSVEDPQCGAWRSGYLVGWITVCCLNLAFRYVGAWWLMTCSDSLNLSFEHFFGAVNDIFVILVYFLYKK